MKTVAAVLTQLSFGDGVYTTHFHGHLEKILRSGVDIDDETVKVWCCRVPKWGDRGTPQAYSCGEHEHIP